MIINNEQIELEPFGIWVKDDIQVTGNKSINYSADFSKCEPGQTNVSGTVWAFEQNSISYVLEPDTPYFYRDFNNKSDSGNPAVRVLTYNTISPDAVTKVELSGVDYVFETKRNSTMVSRATEVAEFNPKTYDVIVNGQEVSKIAIKLGGVYTLQTYVTPEGIKTNLTVITPANSIHILWLIPQYIIITMGEVMFSVTGLEFAFTQAPISMKSLLQAGWLLTVAFGNLIVVLVAQSKLFDRQVRKH